MYIIIKSDRGDYEFDVSPNIPIYKLKKELSIKAHHSFMYSKFMFRGRILDDNSTLEENDVEDGCAVEEISGVRGGGSENNSYATNINCQNKRGNIGNTYGYLIKGSNEGSVWGDGIYTDDSNIAKAAVLEGKCQLGEEKEIIIKIVEGKSSYSSISKNGISSSSWGSWDGSYILVKTI